MPAVTSITGPSFDAPVLKGDTNGDGVTDGGDRGVIVRVWTGGANSAP